MTETYLPDSPTLPRAHKSVFNFKSTEAAKLMVFDALLQAVATTGVTITEYSTLTFNKVETVRFAVRGSVQAIRAIKAQIESLEQKLLAHRPSEY
jgi:ABC-type uncharacterized transport system substrate-binding protein